MRINWGSNEIVACGRREGTHVFSVVPWCVVRFAGCLVRLGLVEPRRMQERVVRDETAHPLLFRGVSSSLVAGRWHLLAVQT